MRFAIRLMRNRALTWSAALMFVTASVLVGLFVTVKAFALTAQQVDERDLGRFDARVELATPEPPDLAGVRRAGGRDITVTLSSTDVRPSVVDPPVTRYLEADWGVTPFPARFALTSGRWPRHAGEAVVTAATGSSLAVPHGTLRVVGTVRDSYSGWNTILAAPGTFATIRGEGVSATTTVYWNGPASAGAALAGTVVARDTRHPRSWIERNPLVHRIPALALPVLTVLAISGLTGAWSRRTRTLLHSVGVRQTYAVGVAATASTLVWTALGIGAGIGIGLLVRTILARDRAEPFSPVPDLLPPTAQLLLVTSLACGVYFRRGTRAAGPAARRYLAVLLVGAVAFAITRSDGVTGAMVVTALVGAVVLLLVPDLVPRLAGLLPERDPRLRLGARRLRDRGASAVVVLTAALTPALALMTLLATDLAHQEASVVPDAPSGQVIVSGRAGIGHPPPDDVLAAVRTRITGQGVRTGFLPRQRLLVVDSPDDVSALDHRALTPTELESLRSGRFVPFTDPSWRSYANGVVLAAHTTNAAPSAVVFTDVPDDIARAAQQAVADARLGHSFVLVHRPPEPAVLPTSLYAVAIGPALLAVLTAAAVAGTRARTSRDHATVLTAVGVGKRWIQQLLLLESGVTTAISLGLALLVALPPMALAGVAVRVPWGHVGLLAAGCALAVLVAGSRPQVGGPCSTAGLVPARRGPRSAGR
ncbi:hypothetical protein [Saccharothrix australiensis]|uniref:FtsX-like permease family protein n=1 Tax=Saccharothrix australiensis TaxID=2072 RepID=A0A495VYE0_9PSEU|nr:hypothetical protein [Saccharothrix australiensis]RKT54422.1 hypothetical protein C8E97_3043 [Saccharothrix australiensis]